MGLPQSGQVLRRRPARGEAGTHRLQLGHDVEHLHQTARTDLGTFVAEVGPRRLMEMFDVMAEMEAMCARLAARRATAEDLAALRKAHDGCAQAAEHGDCDGYYYENEIFHECIRAASRNEFLVEQADALQKRLKAYRRLQLRARDRLRASFAEHDAIVKAIESGDAEGAADAMRDHVMVQGERFADLLASLEPPAAKSA